MKNRNEIERSRRGALRCIHRLALGTVAALPLWAAAPAALAGNNMTFEEKTKVRKAISLIESALKDSLEMTLTDIFNPMGQGGMQVGYEETGGGATTLKEALNQLRNMLDQDRLQSNDIGGRGSTSPRPGTDNDRIRINEDTLDLICNGTPVEMATNKIFLGATLMNEMVHVYQIFEGVDEKQCDAERDSDCASIKYLEEIVAALTDDMGDAHDSLDDIADDAEAVAGLKKCLEDMGVDTAEEIEDVVDAVKERLQDYKDRKADVFEDNIDNGTSWGMDYYGAGYTDPIKFPERDRDARDSTSLRSNDGLTSRDFFLSTPGALVVHSAVYLNKLNQTLLVTVSTSPIGELAAHIWLDQDGDGLPETPEAAIVPFKIPPSTKPRALSDVMIFVQFDPLLSQTLTSDNGLLFLDVPTGTLFALELDALGLPLLPPAPLFSAPPLDLLGGFHFLSFLRPVGPNQLLFVFSNTPNVSQFGHVNTFAVIFDTVLGNGFPQPPATLAQWTSPLNPIGPETLEGGAPTVTLNGNPGQPVTMFSIGRGSASLLGFGAAGPDGSTGPLPVSIQPNDLFVFSEGAGPDLIAFLPTLGQNIDCTMLDETFDNMPDRIHLSRDPARLHFMTNAGSAPTVDSFFDIAYEIALENPDPRGISAWEPTSRTILGEEIDTEIIALSLTGSGPPIFIQSAHDFDLDGAQDDAIQIKRDLGGGQFEVESFFDVDTPLFMIRETIPLPPAFEPNGVNYGDVSGDDIIDIEILPLDLVGLQPICLINNGAGFFTIGPCAAPPCPADFNGDGAVNAADLAQLLGAWGPGNGPEDLDMSGAVNAADLAQLLGAWGPCP